MLEEAKNINKSLSALGNCISALTTGASHIPFRDSQLTRLLQARCFGLCCALRSVCSSRVEASCYHSSSPRHSQDSPQTLPRSVCVGHRRAPAERALRCQQQHHRLCLQASIRCEQLLLSWLTSPHLTSPHNTSHHITAHHLTSPQITSHHLTSPHLTSHHLTSPHITSHHITSHHVTSHHLTTLHLLLQVTSLLPFSST